MLHFSTLKVSCQIIKVGGIITRCPHISATGVSLGMSNNLLLFVSLSRVLIPFIFLTVSLTIFLSVCLLVFSTYFDMCL